MRVYLQFDIIETNYLATVKQICPAPIVASSADPVTIRNLVNKAREKGCDGIVTSDVRVLKLLLPDNPKASVDTSAGSYFEEYGMPIVIMSPLKQAITVNYGPYVMRRYFTKITHPQLWMPETEFNYIEVTADLIGQVESDLSTSEFIVIDIETPLHPSKLIIGDYGYTGIWWDAERKLFVTRSYVVDMDSMAKVNHMRRINAMPQPKIGQNFKYDLSFMHKWNAPVTNWRFDTITLMHSWLSELPKDLGFVTTFICRKAFNWKYKGHSPDRAERVKYNAMDTWGTANAFLALIREMPEWAVNNFHMEFPMNFPCFLNEVQGIKVNIENFNKAREEREAAMLPLLASIQKMTVKEFNPSSPKQCVKLFNILGFRDIKSADEKTLAKIRFKSAIAARIIKSILDYRAVRKEITTYLTPDAIYEGRCFFAANPHGTDTGRLACKKHQFSFGTTDSNRKNVGLQLQTIPRGDDAAVKNFEVGIKHIFEADDGDFLFGELDYAQAEARDVAYLSGDEGLIHAVECGKDFHALNASAFFGVPYDKIYRDLDYYDEDGNFFEHGTINKVLRNLAKRVNHGANYNMGAFVLIETMGEDKILEAQKLLALPFWWTIVQVAEHLLTVYERTYPDVKGTWYKQLIHEVRTTKLLVGGTGWTRKCFGNPLKNKRDLNAIVAHKPQNLNAMTLNKAVMKVFYYALDHYDTFRFSMQIHDSILLQYKRGHDYHVKAVVDMMTMALPIKDARGNVRMLTVPADAKHGARIWGEIKD